MSRPAFFLRFYTRYVLAVIVLMIVAVNVAGTWASTLVALAALVYAVARAIARLPERRRWLKEAATDPLVLTSPFEARWRIAAGGPDPGSNHHLIASDQRFAYDLVCRKGPSAGARILAPIAGRIVEATDGMPDHRASLRVTEDPSPLGNHVAIDTGRGVVFLCHLQNGSVRVRTGDEVVAGIEVGRCGNSGRTSRPHLHIHAQDLPEYAFNRARGIPIRFQLSGSSS